MDVEASEIRVVCAGYRLTGSGLRGQQWLDTVKGKKDKR